MPDNEPYVKPSPPTPACRCRGCGADDPMGCGALCADCSWEDHLEHLAYTGSSFGEPHEGTPGCCRAAASGSTQNPNPPQ